MPKWIQRANEKNEFAIWLSAKNTDQTRAVGITLAVLAVVIAVAVQTGILNGSRSLYLICFLAISAGLVILEYGRRKGRRGISRAGELVIFVTAVYWMFAVILERMNFGYGLAEFTIGILAVVLSRYMKPAVAIFLFSSFAIAYGLTLSLSGNFDFSAWLSAIAFCSFAALWSVKAYENRLLEFRNRKLLNRLQEKNRRLDALALQDTLTGLPNRRYFDRILDRCWTDPDLAGQSIALILLDIDHFKEYNDKNGHPAGDVCLQRVARALSSVMRTDGTAIRIGGEEFAVILERATVDDALVAAKRLTEAVRQDGLVTTSAGVAAAVPETDAPENLYKSADDALYRAKNSGRNRIERG